MTEEELLEAIINGEERIWRFSEQEQKCSSNAADRFLWLAVLRAEQELAHSVFGGNDGRSSETACGATCPCRFLKAIAQALPPSFSDLTTQIGLYEDRGQESIVCNAGDGFVNKLRPMKPSPLSGYLAPLANVIYHNRLFPSERYVLENIYMNKAQYFMVLRQARVEILLDSDGYPVRPSADMIRAAIGELSVGLTEYCGNESEVLDSSSSEIGGGSLRFYNSDYYISDLQPGRNTVIDALTGRVRFIDPRITLNDPDGPITGVSRMGKRHEDMPGQLFE